MASTLAGVEAESVQQMISRLTLVKNNLRRLIAQRSPDGAAGERRYG